MDKIIILGTTHFSSVVYQTIVQEHQGEVLAFTLNKEYMSDIEFEGLPVVPFEDLSDLYDMNDVQIAITIGYKKMNDNRRDAYNRCKASGYKIYTYISNKACVYSKEIGEGSIILPTAFVGPYVQIGKSVILWNRVSLCHHSSVGDFTHIAGGTMVGGDVSIGSSCFIGMNCTIKNGITIGDRTFLGANSYMAQDTVGGLGFIGVPAVNQKGIKSDLMIKFL